MSDPICTWMKANFLNNWQNQTFPNQFEDGGRLSGFGFDERILENSEIFHNFFLFLLPLSHKIATNLQEHTTPSPSYFYWLFLIQQLNELTNLKPDEIGIFNNQIIYKFVVWTVFLSLIVLSQIRWQFET